MNEEIEPIAANDLLSENQIAQMRKGWIERWGQRKHQIILQVLLLVGKDDCMTPRYMFKLTGPVMKGGQKALWV